MNRVWMRYRIAGAVGGLLLIAGNYYGPLCILQLLALLPVMICILQEPKPGAAAVAGLYMGLVFTIPQMITLRMPIPITMILLVWFTLLLIVLCLSCALFLPRSILFGPLAVGASWALLDWTNYTTVPFWGMAQSLARSWTGLPFLIQFISITGISGVLLIIGTLQGLTAHFIVNASKRKQAGLAMVMLILVLSTINSRIWFQKPIRYLRVAAAGWVFDDRTSEVDPHTPEGFEQFFAAPARQAAQEGARIFTTGELGFYIAGHQRDFWMERFSRIARDNKLWLAVGYFNIDENKNRMFFMAPKGQVETEYTKTCLTPFEPGWNGDGDLKTIEVEGISVGGMICQDDNFARLTRYYGRYKTPIVLCPTADWQTIKNAHLQAVRARAIEGKYAIVRGAANGISAAIDATGIVLAAKDHDLRGPGWITADLPIYESVTVFSRFGHIPLLFVSAAAVILAIRDITANRAAGENIKREQHPSL